MSDLLRALVEELATDTVALERLRALVGVPDPAEPEPFIGVPEAAEHIACKRRRIYDLVEADRLPHHRDGSRLLFRRSELDAWVSSDGRSADTVSDRKGAGRRANVPGRDTD